MSKGPRKNVICRDPYTKLIPAQDLRVGRQLFTDDGWQTIVGLVVFQDADQVSVYTEERNDVETEGWRFHFGDFVQMRSTPTQEQIYQEKHLERIERRRRRRLAMAAAECPEWCADHYDGGEGQERQRNHSSEPLTVIGADADDGKPAEFGVLLERRDSRATGGTETVLVLEVRPHAGDIELTLDTAHLLASRIQSLAHRGQMFR